MIDKNPLVLARAFKSCRGKIEKIAELGIRPDLDEETIDALIETLSEAKAAADSSVTGMEEFVAGQRWYVESLVAFSKLTTEKQLQAEYDDSFPELASETEMYTALEGLKAANG
ncbi:MAG: hypothetical protein GY820_10375 [Gammaproteobacteria bacterium]|nr:hypothetical protein [Gammaproteobacteria bacterium]